MRSTLLLLVAGCAPLGDVPDVPVSSATLVDLDTHAFAVIAGPVGGDALLVYSTPDGAGGAIPVAVSGGTVGGLFNMSLDLAPNANVALDLSEADPDLRLPDLLGTYRGTGWNVGAVIGGSGHNLRNRAGVRLSDGHFTGGAGMYGGFEWLRIREGGKEQADDDFWDLWVDDTGDTALHDTGTLPIDTGPAPVDTGRQGSSGCQGGSDPSPEPEPAVPDEGGSGCGGESSGCEVDGGSDCACAVANGPPPLLAIALAVTLLRRRRAEA